MGERSAGRRRLDVLVQPEHVRAGRSRSSARRGGRRSRRRRPTAPRPRSPRKLTYARPVEASAAGVDHGARPLACGPSRACGSCQPVTALSTKGMERSANAVASRDPAERAAHLVHVDLALGAGRREVELAQAVDELVVEAGQVRRLEVGVDPLRPQRVDERLDHGGTASGRAGRRPARRRPGTRARAPRPRRPVRRRRR